MKMAIRLADRFLPGQFSVESVQGRLVDHFVLEGFNYVDGSDVVSIDRVELSWNPASLWRKELAIESLLLKGVSLVVPAGEADDPGSEDTPFPPFVLPLAITMENGAVDTLMVKTSEDTPIFQLSTLVAEDFSGKGSMIRVANFAVTAEQYRIGARGQLQTGQVYTARLDVDYSFNNDGLPIVSGKGVLNGSLDELAYEANIVTPFAATAKGVVSDLAGNLSWQGSLRANAINVSELSPEWPELMLTQFQASGEGTFSSYSLNAAALASFDQYRDIHIGVNLHGDADGLELTAARLDHGDMAVNINGQVGWKDTLAWQGKLVGSNIDPAVYDSRWPGLLNVEVNASGRQTDKGLTAAIDLVDLAGELKGYPVQAGGKMHVEGDKLVADSFIIQSSDSSVTLNGYFGWKDRLAWQAEVVGRNINPVIYDSRWPGHLEIEAYTSGQQTDKGVAAVIDLARLDGELRGFPLHGKGKVKVDDNDIDIDTLVVRSSDSVLRASGYIADTVDLSLEVEASDLNTVWPDLAGSMEAEARITGARQQPAFTFDISGDTVIQGETRVDSVHASGTGTLAPEGSLTASLAAAGVTVGGTLLETISLDVVGMLGDHSFEARVNSAASSFMFGFIGGYAERSWRGHISSGSIETGQMGDWQLQHSVPVALSAGMVDIDTFCLTGAQSALVCVEGKYEQSGHWSAAADITALPVDLFESMQNRFSELDGFLAGSADFQGQGSVITGGVLDLSTDELSLLLDFPEEYNREIVWRSNEVHAVLDGNDAEVNISSILQDGSSITAKAAITEIGIFPYAIETALVQGRVDVDLRDLQPVNALTFPAVEASGTLQGGLELRGRLARPDFLGTVGLGQGKMIVPALGITIRDVEMNMNSKERGVHLEVNATSGEGTMHAEGDYVFDREEASPLVLDIKGDGFEIVNLPDAKIRISPDLQMNVTKQRGMIQGDILVTEAYISTQKISGAVAPSRDIVFVDSQDGEQETAWPLHASITVAAGENVRVNAFGLRGKIEGRLKISEQPHKTATGDGDLEVREGTFTVYGRQLQIVKGRLLYSGNPLDNPGIEVRAENTSSGVTTGIEVSGFLREPDLAFYSTPPMEQDEIIRRLLLNTSLVGSSKEEGFLGSVASDAGMDPVASTFQDIKEGLHVDDVKIESGKAGDDLALVIGTWLSPRLYISYGKNLLKESGNFNTRYILGHGFFLETETGPTQSGADLMYEIDR
ncbi:MAG: translocation/assembly module TamB domain-containing protein [Desulfobulbaceae bacterium]|nr:translocation/assembly module TamB domain-containing protein [Desulfobulbaceae bacterium]